MLQSIRDFKTRYVLAIKYISALKETLKLLLNIRIILFSNKKQQCVNYFVKNLKSKRKATEF